MKKFRKLKNNALGKIFKDGEIIIKQGDVGDCMYVIQSGVAVVVQAHDGKEVKLAELMEGDFFGEMTLFESGRRSATVYAKGETCVLTIDKKTLMRRISEDPHLAFRLLKKMASRIRELNEPFSRISAGDRRNWETRPHKIESE
jgi:CRP-like cAMP-binding protein